MKVHIGVIGCGQWGQNYLRNFSDLPDRARIVAVADSDPKRLAEIQLRYPGARASIDPANVMCDPEVNAVIIATPSSTHARLVSEALDAGKHVLVEKPFTLDPGEGERLIARAKQAGGVLLVGHVYEYNPAVERMRSIIANRSLGETYYIQSTRTNLGPIRDDVNALWDLAPHDISILLYLLGTAPTSVSATGASFFENGRHDVVFGTLTFPRQVVGHLHVSWLDPRKIRQITVVGSSRMLVFDDLNTLEPVRVYDRGLSEVPTYRTFGEFQLVPRFGEISIPYIPIVEPLRAQCEHFLDCVEGRASPRSDGADGLRVVRVLAAMQRSLELDGTAVPVES
jgi:predicted dehydrogenase